MFFYYVNMIDLHFTGAQGCHFMCLQLYIKALVK